MFKVGGGKFLTSFVCDQQIAIDTDIFVTCQTRTIIKEAFYNNNQQHQKLDFRDIFNIKCSTKIEEECSVYFAGYMTTLSQVLKRYFSINQGQ